MSRLSHVIRSLCARLARPCEGMLLPLQQPDFPVAVCWSAKSGCTTVLKWFLAHAGLLEEAVAYSGWLHDYREDKLFTSRGYVRQSLGLFRQDRGGKGLIRVVRDPATRAVSSFLHYLRVSRAMPHWPEATGVTGWKAAVGLAGQPGLSFREFLMFVAARQANGEWLDPHFRPQYDRRQDPWVETHVCLEDMAAGLRGIEDRYGLPHVDIRHLSESCHHNPPTTSHAWPDQPAEFPADGHTLEELGTPRAEAFLDPETRLLIRTAYWADYAAFGHHYEAASATRLQMPATGLEAPAQRPRKPASSSRSPAVTRRYSLRWAT